jgi:hypothetical protein
MSVNSPTGEYGNSDDPETKEPVSKGINKPTQTDEPTVDELPPLVPDAPAFNPYLQRPPEQPPKGPTDELRASIEKTMQENLGQSPYAALGGDASWTDPSLRVDKDKTVYKVDPSSKNINVMDKDGNVSTITPDEQKQRIEEAKRGFGQGSPGWNFLLTGGGLALDLAFLGLPVGTTAAEFFKDRPMTPEQKDKFIEALRQKGYDERRIEQILKGEITAKDLDKNGNIIDPKTKEEDRATAEGKVIPDRTGKSAGDRDGAVSSTPTAAPVAPAAPVKTPEQIAAENASVSNEAEKKRFESLVKSYNPMANMEQFSAVNVGTAKNPTIAEAEKKMNDLIALGARSDAVGQQARADLSQLTQMTPQNRDAWLQYYRPQDYVATAAQGVAGQAATLNVAQAQQMQGTYQGDLSALRNYDSQIARSSERENAVQLGDLLMRRAQGLEPSVAELSYKQNLDALTAAQEAAVGSMRGQDRALGLRSLAGNVSQQGQKAVGDTAILRLQEQQAAEQAAAAQYNAIMIEDQKVASQEKIDELSRSINLVQGELANAQNTLEKDKFNADAINMSNRLEAQLRAQVDMLNAQQRTQASLENASMQTDVSLQNAMKALDANKWAGDSSQAALTSQINLERGDWTKGYDTRMRSLADAMDATKAVAGSLATMGSAQEGWKISEDQQAFTQSKWADDRKRIDAAASEVEKQKTTDMVINLIEKASKDPYVREKLEEWKKSLSS